MESCWAKTKNETGAEELTATIQSSAYVAGCEHLYEVRREAEHALETLGCRAEG